MFTGSNPLRETTHTLHRFLLARVLTAHTPILVVGGGGGGGG